MPQLDFSTFPPQLVWLAITFLALYWVMSRIALPRISTVLEHRRDRIASDLDDAKRLRDESEEAVKAYEAELAEARSKANTIASAAKEKLNAEMDEQRAKVDAEIAQKLSEAETHISEIKAKALGEVGAAASETAGAIVSQLIGAKTTKTELNAAVKAVSQE